MSTDASWQQAANLLTLVSNKGTPSEQIQRLYSSGLLSDLLDANIDEINRLDFRKFLGLGPIFQTDKHGRILITVTGLGLTGGCQLLRIFAAGFLPTEKAKNILSQPDYNDKHRLEQGRQYTVALISSEMEFPIKARRNMHNLRMRAKRDYGKSDNLRGELALLLREAVSDEQLERWGVSHIAVLHEPIVDSRGTPRVLGLDLLGNGGQVGAYEDRPDRIWDDGMLAFPIS